MGPTPQSMHPRQHLVLLCPHSMKLLLPLVDRVPCSMVLFLHLSHHQVGTVALLGSSAAPDLRLTPWRMGGSIFSQARDNEPEWARLLPRASSVACKEPP